MRRFKLKNALGQEFDLMRKDAFFHSPDGLGYSADITSSDLGDYYIAVDEKLSQKTVTGEMIFSTYEMYDIFIEFCMHSPLILFKNSGEQSSEWEQATCTLSKLSLSEIGAKSRRLICPIDFLLESPWKREQTYQTTNSGSIKANGYPHGYPRTYVSAQNSAVKVNNPGNKEAPIKITILGKCTYPHYSLRQNGIEVAQGTIKADIESGYRLIIDSNPETAEISIYSITGECTDAYQMSDFSTERFIYAPPGTSILQFSQTGGDNVTAIVEVSPIVR